MWVMWLWEEKKVRGDEIRGTATFLYERAAKAVAAVIAGAGAKLAHAKPNMAESTAQLMAVDRASPRLTIKPAAAASRPATS